MIKKPKIHPEYGINLVGIQFGIRWNAVLCATQQEIINFISNYRLIKSMAKKPPTSRDWWATKKATINESSENAYYRKLWKVRHSQTFDKSKLYRIDKKSIYRWDTKLSSSSGVGTIPTYLVDRDRNFSLSRNDIMIYSHMDDLGNVFFMKADSIDVAHLYAFSRESRQLQYFIEIES
jgi:hypothetical protein